ncbi:DNA-directed RNA polymerase subunit L [Candidatus Woesearchaeota archaeon]|nr:DNA-directed RNA polymerase subunit L [Candidatus Woesearchaeota archaeon]
MEITVLEDTKKRLKLELGGVDKGFLHAFKKRLWNHKDVEVATYNVPHPLIDKIEFIVDTSGKTSPREAIEAVVKDMAKANKTLAAEFKKIIK